MPATSEAGENGDRTPTLPAPVPIPDLPPPLLPTPTESRKASVSLRFAAANIPSKTARLSRFLSPAAATLVSAEIPGATTPMSSLDQRQ